MMPLAPSRRAVSMFSTVRAGDQPVRADPGPHRPDARRLPGTRDLRREDRGVRRIGHRADDVEPAVLDPESPILEPAGRRLRRRRDRPPR